MQLREQLATMSSAHFAKLSETIHVQNFLSRSSTLQDYENLLRSIYSFWSPLEVSLRKWTADLMIQPFERTKDLIDDLEFLGTPRHEILSMAYRRFDFEISSLTDAYAARYVLDGTLKKTQMFAAIVKSRWSFVREGGASFFDGPYETSHNYWMTVLDAMRSAESMGLLAGDTLSARVIELLHALNNLLNDSGRDSWLAGHFSVHSGTASQSVHQLD